MTNDSLGAEADGRFEFIFGGMVRPSEWQDATTIEDRLPLMARRFGALTEAEQYIRLAVVEELLAIEPPQVWETAQRLTAAGLDADDVLDELAMAFAQTAREGLGTRSFATERYLARLEWLPLPDPAVIERLLLEAAATAVVISTKALVVQVIERLGLADDDPLPVRLVEHIAEDLTDKDGPLVRLPGDRLAHAARLTEGIVLTHVLKEAERASGTLDVSFDLAGFARTRDPTFYGEPLERISPPPDSRAWQGPRGWLDLFAPGTVLAVRVGGDGAVELDTLAATPPINRELVTALRDFHQAAATQAQHPVSADTLVFGLLAKDPTRFRRAQAPLRELCQTAGLRQQKSEIAHRP